MSRPILRRTRWVALATAAALVAACSSEKSGSTTTSPPTTSAATTSTAAATTTTTGTASTPSNGLRAVTPFADYQWVPLLGDDQPYGGAATPTSMEDVLIVEGSQQVLDDPALVAMLERQGFAVEQGGAHYFHDAYKYGVYDYQPIYVTTDALYHTWHLVFDKVLRDLEQESLLPVLQRFLTAAVPAARAQQQVLAGTSLAEAAERATAYYEAAAVLVGLDLGTTSARADEEVTLAQKAAGVTRSPVSGVVECQFPRKFDGCVDYSLFLPRGHYNKSPELQRYFAGMSLLGQEWFGLGQNADAVLPGLLVTRILAADPALEADWRALYEPTAFLVGLADDVTPLEVATAADSAVPGWRDDPSTLEGVDTRSLAAAILAAHPTQIDPERAGIRLMGARFTLDAYVLDQLAWPNVGTEATPRVDVSALDVAAALGSETARTVQLDAGQGAFENYERQLAAMADLVGARQPNDWAGTVYDAWLASLQPQLAARSTAYPDYMRTPAWAAKSLQTALASYTELKHDTILYAKQGSAGEGEGPQPPDWQPRHWVEPDPVAFLRMAASASLLRDGMTDRDLLSDQDKDTLDKLVELTTWLGGVATHELAGTVVNDEENARLDSIGSELEYLWFATADLGQVEGYPVAAYDDSDSVVADIYRSSFDYLELGTGYVDTLWVIVPIADGRFELAKGAVYSYYEFRWPTTATRLTDEEWKSMLSDAQQGGAPFPVPRPSWQAPFLLGATIADQPVPAAEPSDG